MPVYNVLVNGTNLDIPSEDSVRIAGFYKWCVVRATSEQEAAVVACDRVAVEWAAGKYGAVGSRPSLAPTETRKLSLLASLSSKDSGYSFYPHE